MSQGTNIEPLVDAAQITLPSQDKEIEMQTIGNPENISSKENVIDFDENEEEPKIDSIEWVLFAIREQVQKAKVVFSYSLNTEKFSRVSLVVISVLFIVFAITYSSTSTSIGILDCPHIFQHIFFLKLTHVIIAAPNIRSAPTMNSMKLYVMMGVFTVVSLIAFYLYQGLLSFPMQNLGQSMKLGHGDHHLIFNFCVCHRQ
ncbi:hypothetical protein EIN_060490 [Entamoeba invadens IP1]|uniref:hypothetical protein n=1 Tax=Entamoeba invadens IP1 TaxID=370355 RepID=UPI0002C3E527|nr:hypothetical protein EIN_060490 [Entamoeba invadens IP1]ELP93514.1 hypothetical protein EIN_060490 [Entamoeba invadens IP1]|eukprot:XP_004260285.1 hypothetical protein EIN_060490 [Entamoeba invadens IP1]